MDDASSSVDDAEMDDNTEFEIDYINGNPCMRYLTETIQKLHVKICPPSSSEGKPPSWITGLLGVFENANTLQKTYIAKLIANYPFAFEKQADIWIIPLMKFIMNGNFGDPINYLVQDLCIDLIYWGQETKPNERHANTISQFLVSLLAKRKHTFEN